MEQDKVYVRVSLSRSEYEALKERAKRLGYPGLPEYLRDLALKSLGEAPGAGVDVKSLSEVVAERLERKVIDLLNPFTGKIDEINRRLAELIESLEAHREAALEERVERVQQARAERQAVRPQRGWERGDALGRLREEGVFFGEEASWIRSPERFFRFLERRGAIVLDAGGEKIAVDPGFWEKFRGFVEAMDVADAEEAERIVEDEMGEKAARLFRKLVKAGLLTFDEDRGEWTILLPP